ncbi:MAG: hypothetical protein Q8O41_06385 [Candidatus Methanoperedens sp.]|nr:hypothetical protein [Candidatus Methanoperedens sp.]
MTYGASHTWTSLRDMPQQAYVDSRSRRVIGTPMNADLMHTSHAPY